MQGSRRAMLALPSIGLLVVAAIAAAEDPAESRASPDVREQRGIALARSGDQPQAALAELSAAVASRPSSPYAWAAYAEARYRAGVSDATFEAALRRAVELGTNEPAVQEAVAFYGLAVWDEAAPDTRAAVERALTAGMRRDPARMVRIAERRGRLAVACRHAALASQAPEKSSPVCTTTEAR